MRELGNKIHEQNKKKQADHKESVKFNTGIPSSIIIS
jgi:hypothetical protein